MTKLTNGSIELDFEKKDRQLIFTLSAAQYHDSDIDRYRPFLEKSAQLLEGKIEAVSDEELVLSYTVPQYSESVAGVLKNLDDLGRFALARQYSSLVQQTVPNVHFFLHPENLFLTSGHLMVAHRGLTGVVAPETLSQEALLSQYKALVIYTLQPKAQFEELVSGGLQMKDTFSKAIESAESIEAIEGLLDRQYRVLLQTKKAKEVSVKSSRYFSFRVLTFVFAGLVLLLGIGLAYTQLKSVPLQDRIISSQSDFINNNYNGATTDLENEDPKALPKGAQYVLAASYVHLDDLTAPQKEAILNNLSQSSATNELLYWISIGRGNLNEALNIAQNLGDNQLILHAYTKLYDATNANTSMSGSKKQSLLKQYQDAINKYVKLIGGQTNE